MMGVLNPMYPSCPDQTLQLIMFCIIMVDINKPCAKGALIIIIKIKVQSPLLALDHKNKWQINFAQKLSNYFYKFTNIQWITSMFVLGLIVPSNNWNK